MKTTFDIQLSTNFKLSEFVKTSHAKHQDLSIDIFDNLNYGVLNVLQPLRDFLGHPIKVNSGYRNTEVNFLVKGAKNSFHMLGMAADITFRNEEDFEIAFDFLKGKKEVFELLGSPAGCWLHLAWITDVINEYPKKRTIIYNYYV